jgi:hypothetical protein
MHPDHFTGVADTDIESFGPMLFQLALNADSVTDQNDRQPPLAGSSHRSLDLDGRSVVTTHGIHSNDDTFLQPDASYFSVLTISLPLYVPQLGQTRCDCLGSLHWGHMDTPGAVSAS